MLSVLTLLPALLGTGLFAAPQGPGTSDSQNPRAVLEIIPLVSVCGWRPNLQPPLWSSMLTNFGSERLDLLEIGDESLQFDPSTVTEFLKEMNGKAIENDELTLGLAGDTLMVLGAGPLTTRLREQVRQLGKLVARPLDIEVIFWRARDRTAPSTVMSPQEYAEFAASHEPLWRRKASTRSSIPVSLDRSRWNRYVRDVVVEIASKSSLSHPETGAFYEGGQVIVLPHGLVGGDDFALQVQFAWAERKGPVGRIATDIPQSSDIDAPTVASMCGAFSGRITNGGALSATLRGHSDGGPSCTVTVRVSSRTPPEAAQTPGVRVFPTSALTTRALTQRVEPPSLAPAQGAGERQISVSDGAEGFGSISSDSLHELIRVSLSPENQEETTLQMGGGYLFVKGTESAGSQVETLLRALQERLLRTVTVRHTMGLAAPETATGQNNGAGELVHELVLPTLLGRYVTALRRVEMPIVGDLEVEVAEDARITNPVVHLLQFGTWLRARTVAQDSEVHLSMTAQASVGDVPNGRPMAPAGSIILEEVASQRVFHDGTVASGQAVDHGDGPLITVDGRASRSAVETTVRW